MVDAVSENTVSIYRPDLSYAKIILPGGFTGQGVLNKDPTFRLKTLKSYYEFGKVII
jgi:hypothetical protein